MKYRQGSHTKFKIEYHFVWVTKYRYHMLQGDLAIRVRELVRQTCEHFELNILRGAVSKDHIKRNWRMQISTLQPLRIHRQTRKTGNLR